ncbi:MAG: TIGR01440 family protein [Clostridia bacterium]|nr:TIGR01440 family protein [Clostridia bacterium]
MDLEQVKQQTLTAVTELLATANLQKGDILVVGCSSSEIVGGVIGKDSSYHAAVAVVEALLPLLQEKGVYLAAQCCEHLNRAIIIERQAVQKEDVVSVVPKPKAGGSFATAVYERLSNPVAVETIRADAGLDIGDTLIGMHLRAVAVPLRIAQTTIGNAHVVCATTRPKYIGGPRAQYE